MIDYEASTFVLARHLTDQRRSRIERVLSGRIGNVCLVLESLQDPFNVSACMRTAEAFGVQYVHVIEPSAPMDIEGLVSLRAEKWLTVTREANPEAAARFLSGNFYTLLVSTPEPVAPPLSEMDLTGPIALAFGNETSGISPELERLASRRFHIPMRGFTQSLNVTVSVAVSLRELFLSPRFGAEPLPADETARLRYEWYKASGLRVV